MAASLSALRRGPDIHPRDLPVWAMLPLWAAGAWACLHAVLWPPGHTLFGGDAHAYYLTGSETHFYLIPPKYADAYLYSPAFAHVIRPLTALPWPVFLTIWMLAEALVFAWLLAPLGWKWGAPLFVVLCGIEVSLGNINAFLALAAVLGMRHPAYWAFPLLTKVTPGLGPLWFAIRREWRAVRLSVGVTAGIALVSYLVAPAQWSEWLTFMRDNGGPGVGFLYVRIVVALATTIYAARTNRAWLLPVAMVLITPVWSVVPFTMLAAIPRLTAQTPRPTRRLRSTRS